ncbi:MAG: sigma-70 family RNA polymerase sigma factor [Polyangiales bacterium]
MSATPSPAPGLDCGALFDEHASFVWRVLKRHGVPERELADACQEVFLVVHRKLAEFEGRSSVRTWLHGVAVRVALGMRRKAHWTREVMRDDVPEVADAATAHERLERNQQLALIEAALVALSAPKREVFALYELEGMTMAEVARTLDVPENTALSRLYAARDEVRAFIARHTLVHTTRVSAALGGAP